MTFQTRCELLSDAPDVGRVVRDLPHTVGLQSNLSGETWQEADVIRVKLYCMMHFIFFLG